TGYHYHIVSRLDGLDDRVVEIASCGDRAHLHVIGKSQSFEAQFLAQKAGYDILRYGCGKRRGAVKGGIVCVAHHNGVQTGDYFAEEFAVRKALVVHQLIARPVYLWKS